MNLGYLALILMMNVFLACSSANFIEGAKKEKNPESQPPVAGDVDSETDGEDSGSQPGDDPATGNPPSDDSGGGDDGSADGGSADGGNADGGSADGGNADGGSADGGNADGGSADGGNADGGNADGGNADGGNADGGNADGGSADGGNADGGSADGGNADGGNADGGNADGGNADGGSADGGNADGGNADGGCADCGDDSHKCEDPKDQVMDVCERYEQLTLEQGVFFPERVDCSFKSIFHHENTDITPGNLCRKDRYLQAREWQTVDVELPDNAVICGMEIVSRQDQIQYDDFLIFTIEDYILMLSNTDLLRHMPRMDGAYVWDFEAIKGKKYGFNGGRYCLGNNSTCAFPGHDKQGSVNFSVDTEALAPISAKLQGKSSYSFSAIATGDNNDEDCWHTDLELDVKIRYVLKP